MLIPIFGIIYQNYRKFLGNADKEEGNRNLVGKQEENIERTRGLSVRGKKIKSQKREN